MRFVELFEANLSIRTFGERNPEYWTNLTDIIEEEKPFEIKIGSQAQEEVKAADGQAVADMMRAIWDGSDLATPSQVKQISELRIPLEDGREIKVSNIFKSPEIKGKSSDYNVGDIGEIALGISASARFVKKAPIDLNDFVSIGQQLQIGQIPGKASFRGDWEGEIQHSNGRNDKMVLMVALAARSMRAFEGFVQDFQNAPKNVQGTVLSAIKWANENQHVDQGLEYIMSDPNKNTVRISADGVGDQKGTKADLFMHIDDKPINLISAKAGTSQLGQASGVVWSNVNQFFTTVFGEDISQYEKEWSQDNVKNLEVLKRVYSQKIIPKVMRLTGGDDSKKEAELVKQIAGGLIHYANNVGDKGPEIIDIVKLVTTPSNPGYKLMRIDQQLVKAMDEVDLVGSASSNGQGVAVHGIVDGQRKLLFRARSYYSPAAKLTRTIIEGGPLLDYLATQTAMQ